MVSQSPVLLHSRKANSALLVLGRDIFSPRTAVKIKIDAATECSPSNTRLPQKHLLWMSVAKIDTMCIRCVPGRLVVGIRRICQFSRLIGGEVSCVMIDRMTAIDIPVDVVANICRKECP